MVSQATFFTPQSSESPPLLILVLEQIPAITMLTSGCRGKKQDHDTGQHFTHEGKKTVLIVQIVQPIRINDNSRDEESPSGWTIKNQNRLSMNPNPVTPV